MQRNRTIDRVPTGFSNGGGSNYAPFTASLSDGYNAIVSGTDVENQGGACPSTASEYCTGPYLLFDGSGSDAVFPKAGFTVTVTQYLDPSSAPANAIVDTDVSLNDDSGNYLIDNFINACSLGSDGGFVIAFSHNTSGPPCSGSPQVTEPGWYRFVFEFTDTSGQGYVTISVYTEGGTEEATSGSMMIEPSGSDAVSVLGGPNYFWWPTEDLSGLPVGLLALQKGQHPEGQTP